MNKKHKAIKTDSVCYGVGFYNKSRLIFRRD